MNAGEKTESAKSVPKTVRGAVRTAIAYQRAPILHLNQLERISRSPCFPKTKIVTRIPAIIGPVSVTRTTEMNRELEVPMVCAIIIPGIPAGPIKMRSPPQEIRNVRTK